MKPDWKDAPEWANWLAMDDDGSWFWYERKPKASKGELTFGEWYVGGMIEIAYLSNPLKWQESLEKRPLEYKTWRNGNES